jgi:hypothetical protein
LDLEANSFLVRNCSKKKFGALRVSIRYDIWIGFDLVLDLFRLDLDWIGLVRIGLDWIWIGLDWFWLDSGAKKTK